MPSLMQFTPRDFGVAEAEAARLLPAEGPGCARRPLAFDQRDVLVHAGRGLDRRRVGDGPRLLALRGGVGDPCRRVRPPRRRVDAGGEPSVDMAEADANRYPYMTTPPFVLELESSSTGRSTTSSIRASRWLVLASCGCHRSTGGRWSSARSSSSAPGGSVPSGTRRTRRSSPTRPPGSSATRGRRGSGRRSRAPSTSRRNAAAL